jgi:hypothetical protein
MTDEMIDSFDFFKAGRRPARYQTVDRHETGRRMTTKIHHAQFFFILLSFVFLSFFDLSFTT